MSIEEQQADELDALKAIYPSEFTLLNGHQEASSSNEDRCPKFSIKVSSEFYELDSDKYELELMFKLPKNYPNVGPEIEILSSVNLEDHDEIEIYDILNDMIPENIGVVMVFTLVTRAFEWINALKDRKIIEQREAQERRKKELEEMERKKFEGTRVTVESFIAWKIKFDAEMNALAAKNIHMKKEDTAKLTGKEMFLHDKNLIDSDLNFVECIDYTDVDVKVDESLFQDDELIED